MVQVSNTPNSRELQAASATPHTVMLSGAKHLGFIVFANLGGIQGSFAPLRMTTTPLDVGAWEVELDCNA